MIDKTRPLKFPQLKVIGRDPHRLEVIYKVRLDKKLLVINNEAERNKLLFLTWAQINPESAFTKWLEEALYNDPELFNKLELPSADTLLKDNRELERFGFFAKPEKKEPAQPEGLKQTTLT